MWIKIGTALLLGMMVIMLIPHAKNMIKNSPVARPGDWSSFIFAIALVAGLVMILMWLV
jgi:hypothetical protein